MGIKKHQKQLKLDINKNFISLKNKKMKNWINRHDTMNPKRGYNSNKGGGGGPKIKIPMEIVAKYIATGYKLIEISDLLEKKCGICIGGKTLSRRINEYWGSKLEAQKIFLKPVIVKLTIEGYNSKNIIDIFGSHGRNILDRMIPKMFDGMSFSDLRIYYLT